VTQTLTVRCAPQAGPGPAAAARIHGRDILPTVPPGFQPEVFTGRHFPDSETRMHSALHTPSPQAQPGRAEVTEIKCPQAATSIVATVVLRHSHIVICHWHHQQGWESVVCIFLARSAYIAFFACFLACFL
jgi:hypothetical protein